MKFDLFKVIYGTAERYSTLPSTIKQARQMREDLAREEEKYRGLTLRVTDFTQLDLDKQ